MARPVLAARQTRRRHRRDTADVTQRELQSRQARMWLVFTARAIALQALY